MLLSWKYYCLRLFPLFKIMYLFLCVMSHVPLFLLSMFYRITAACLCIYFEMMLMEVFPPFLSVSFSSSSEWVYPSVETSLKCLQHKHESSSVAAFVQLALLLLCSCCHLPCDSYSGALEEKEKIKRESKRAEVSLSLCGIVKLGR